MENELITQLKLMNENIKKMQEIKTYEVIKLIQSYNYQISNLYYYYKKLEKNNTFFMKNVKVNEHTLVYVNLGRGFPQELMDGHWCYVVRIIGTKLLVIPTTSIKSRNETNSFMHYIIKSCSGKKVIKSKLELSEIRCVDIQRTYLKKGMYNVKTSRKEIMKKVIKMIGK